MNIQQAPDYYEFKGLPWMESLVPINRVQAVETYEDVRDDDVYVCTYPKAGTNWTAEIAHKVMYEGDMELAHQSSNEAYLEIVPADDTKQGSMKGYMPQTLEELSELPSPRVMRTHLHVSMLPSRVLNGKAKVIYVYRNPRDIAVSLYHWIIYEWGLRGMKAQIPWSEFFENFNTVKNAFGSWFDHYKDCQDHKDKKNILILRYEDMKLDLPAAVEKIANFLGKSLSPEVVQRISDSCTFESMKAEHPQSQLLRKGISGDWKNTFTIAQSERMTEEVQLIKERLGLVIDYE